MKFTAPVVISLAILGATIVGCSRENVSGGESHLKGEATFDPAPAAGDQDSIAAQLKRYKGQTKFLNPYTRYALGAEPSARSADRSALGGGRDIQESDIFKVGKPGSKLLFLLNNYRGLQVVSFAEGAEQPKLLGRAPATGNWPDDMYYDADGDRLIVLENVYNNDEADAYDYSEVQSRLLVYDVSTPETPKLAKTVELTGTLSESRMVGDVLYVATSVRPNWYDRRSGESQESKGYVYSFDLTTEDASLVQQYELSAAVSWGEKMNVLSVQEGDATKYYLVAVLSKSGWGFWDRQSVVEVVDISDAKGAIKPVMNINARGTISERSQTLIKNRTLIVTSNFQVDDTGIQRIAVETFTFPSEASETIDADEAEYRRLHMERALAKKEKALRDQGISGDDLAAALKAYKDELLSDKELGLKGRFVKIAAANGSTILQKKVPDSSVTVGSTQGLNASLQDVRAAGDQLYVYWVPANNIDPLDIFDISAPEVGVKHLTHLEFDGWIQRAIPMVYNGRTFVLGLGWIIPSVDNDQLRRYPQAVLFEITKNAAGRLSAEVLAQKNLGSSSTWANFNATDKMIEVKFTGEGQGHLLYTFASWDGTSYLNGGKLIGFDVTKVDLDPDSVFAEGAVLAGEDGWLRRMFTNPEIDRINSFTDQALGVYGASSGIGNAGAIEKAVATLELARNVQAYATLTHGDKNLGVQIISEWNWYGSESSTELRLVAPGRADSELAAAHSVAKLDGRYIDSLLIDDSTMIILTERYVRIGTDANSYQYKIEFIAARVGLTAEGALATTGEVRWQGADLASGPRLGWQQKLLKLASGKIIAATGRGVLELGISADGLTVAPVAFQGCLADDTEYGNLALSNGKLFVTYAQVVKDPDQPEISYLKNFLAAYDDGSAQCGKAINIPGTIVNALDDHLVTSDTRFIDRVVRGSGDNTWTEIVTENALDSLVLADDKGTATLRDLYDPKDVSIESMKVMDGEKLVFVESTARRYSPIWGFDRFVRDDVWMPRGSRTEQRLVVLGFDDEQSFTKSAYQLTLPLNSAASLKALVDSGDAAIGHYAVIGQGRKLAVMALKGDERPVAKKLLKVNANFGLEPAAEVVTLEGYGWYWYGDQKLTYSTAEKSFAIPQGLFGVAQVYVAD